MKQREILAHFRDFLVLKHVKDEYLQESLAFDGSRNISFTDISKNNFLVSHTPDIYITSAFFWNCSMQGYRFWLNINLDWYKYGGAFDIIG